jgi:hypothetical protein
MANRLPVALDGEIPRRGARALSLAAYGRNEPSDVKRLYKEASVAGFQAEAARAAARLRFQTAPTLRSSVHASGEAGHRQGRRRRGGRACRPASAPAQDRRAAPPSFTQASIRAASSRESLREFPPGRPPGWKQRIYPAVKSGPRRADFFEEERAAPRPAAVEVTPNAQAIRESQKQQFAGRGT